jgi:site-specific DNA recombinase
MKRNRQESRSPAEKLGDKKVAIYSRKSKFTGKGESIENQVKTCRAYLQLHFPDVPEESILEFEDEGFSGKNTQRPQFKAMMDGCKRGEVGLVICYRLDRFSRKTLDFLRIADDLESWGVSFVSVNDHFDTTTPTGRAMMTMTSAFSQLERETIQERICDNLIELAKTGRWLGGQTPTGYQSQAVQSVDIGGKKRVAYQLTPIPEQVQLVRLIYSKFIELNSLSALDTYLLEHGISTKNDKQFSRYTIKSILQNPVYMIADRDAFRYFSEQELELFAAEEEFDGKRGMMCYNKTSQSKGRGNEFLDMSEWVIAVGAHEGVIAGADWVKVQRLLGQNKSKSFRKPKSHNALLSGLLFCGNCGAYLRPKLSQRTNKNGEVIYAYLCETKERSNGACCDLPRPNGNTLDALVCEKIKELAGNPEIFAQQLEQYSQQIANHSEEYDNEMASLAQKSKEIDTQIQNLIQAIAMSSEVTQSYMQQQIEALHQQKQDLQRRMDEIQSITRDYLIPEEEVAILVDMLSSFAGTFDRMSIEEKRTALRRFVQRVEYHSDDDVKIFLLGSETEPQGGGCKRNPNVLPESEEKRTGCFDGRTH